MSMDPPDQGTAVVIDDSLYIETVPHPAELGMPVVHFAIRVTQFFRKHSITVKPLFKALSFMLCTYFYVSCATSLLSDSCVAWLAKLSPLPRLLQLSTHVKLFSHYYAIQALIWLGLLTTTLVDLIVNRRLSTTFKWSSQTYYNIVTSYVRFMAGPMLLPNIIIYQEIRVSDHFPIGGDVLSLTHIAISLVFPALMIILGLFVGYALFNHNMGTKLTRLAMFPSIALMIDVLMRVVMCTLAGWILEGGERREVARIPYGLAGAACVVTGVSFIGFPMYVHLGIAAIHTAAHMFVGTTALLTAAGRERWWPLMVFAPVFGVTVLLVRYILQVFKYKNTLFPADSSIANDAKAADLRPTLTRSVFHFALTYSLSKNLSLDAISESRNRLNALHMMPVVEHNAAFAMSRISRVADILERLTGTRAYCRAMVVMATLCIRSNPEATIYEADRAIKMYGKLSNLTFAMLMAGMRHDAEAQRHAVSTGFDSALLKQFHAKQRLVRRQTQEVKVAMEAFWSQLSLHDPNLQLLFDYSADLYKRAKDAEMTHLWLLDNFPEREGLIRAYADFTRDVIQDVRSADKLRQFADLVHAETHQTNATAGAARDEFLSEFNFSEHIRARRAVHVREAPLVSGRGYRVLICSFLASMAALLLFNLSASRVQQNMADAFVKAAQIRSEFNEVSFVVASIVYEDRNPGALSTHATWTLDMRGRLNDNINDLAGSIGSYCGTVDSLVLNAIIPAFAGDISSPSVVALMPVAGPAPPSSAVALKSVQTSFAEFVALAVHSAQAVARQDYTEDDLAIFHSNTEGLLHAQVNTLIAKLQQVKSVVHWFVMAINTVIFLVSLLIGLGGMALTMYFSFDRLHTVQAEHMALFLRLNKSTVANVLGRISAMTIDDDSTPDTRRRRPSVRRRQSDADQSVVRRESSSSSDIESQDRVNTTTDSGPGPGTMSGLALGTGKRYVVSLSGQDEFSSSDTGRATTLWETTDTSMPPADIMDITDESDLDMTESTGASTDVTVTVNPPEMTPPCTSDTSLSGAMDQSDSVSGEDGFDLDLMSDPSVDPGREMGMLGSDPFVLSGSDVLVGHTASASLDLDTDNSDDLYLDLDSLSLSDGLGLGVGADDVSGAPHAPPTPPAVTSPLALNSIRQSTPAASSDSAWSSPTLPTVSTHHDSTSTFTSLPGTISLTPAMKVGRVITASSLTEVTIGEADGNLTDTIATPRLTRRVVGMLHPDSGHDLTLPPHREGSGRVLSPCQTMVSSSMETASYGAFLDHTDRSDVFARKTGHEIKRRVRARLGELRRAFHDLQARATCLGVLTLAGLLVSFVFSCILLLLLCTPPFFVAAFESGVAARHQGISLATTTSAALDEVHDAALGYVQNADMWHAKQYLNASYILEDRLIDLAVLTTDTGGVSTGYLIDIQQAVLETKRLEMIAMKAMAMGYDDETEEKTPCFLRGVSYDIVDDPKLEFFNTKYADTRDKGFYTNTADDATRPRVELIAVARAVMIDGQYRTVADEARNALHEMRVFFIEDPAGNIQEVLWWGTRITTTTCVVACITGSGTFISTILLFITRHYNARLFKLNGEMRAAQRCLTHTTIEDYSASDLEAEDRGSLSYAALGTTVVLLVATVASTTVVVAVFVYFGHHMSMRSAAMEDGLGIRTDLQYLHDTISHVVSGTRQFTQAPMPPLAVDLKENYDILRNYTIDRARRVVEGLEDVYGVELDPILTYFRAIDGQLTTMIDLMSIAFQLAQWSVGIDLTSYDYLWSVPVADMLTLFRVIPPELINEDAANATGSNDLFYVFNSTADQALSTWKQQTKSQILSFSGSVSDMKHDILHGLHKASVFAGDAVFSSTKPSYLQFLAMSTPSIVAAIVLTLIIVIVMVSAIKVHAPRIATGGADIDGREDFKNAELREMLRRSITFLLSINASLFVVFIAVCTATCFTSDMTAVASTEMMRAQLFSAGINALHVADKPAAAATSHRRLVAGAASMASLQHVVESTRPLMFFFLAKYLGGLLTPDTPVAPCPSCRFTVADNLVRSITDDIQAFNEASRWLEPNARTCTATAGLANIGLQYMMELFDPISTGLMNETQRDWSAMRLVEEIIRLCVATAIGGLMLWLAAIHFAFFKQISLRLAAHERMVATLLTMAPEEGFGNSFVTWFLQDTTDVMATESKAN